MFSYVLATFNFLAKHMYDLVASLDQLTLRENVQ